MHHSAEWNYYAEKIKQGKTWTRGGTIELGVSLGIAMSCKLASVADIFEGAVRSSALAVTSNRFIVGERPCSKKP